MKIAIVGTGYAGLVSGACFAEVGQTVICLDRDEDKIAQLKEGKVPLYEPGLEAMVARNRECGRLHFDTSVAKYVNDVDILFLAVGTPSLPSGEADLASIWETACEIADSLKHSLLVAIKSTVPVGTSAFLKEYFFQKTTERGLDATIDVAFNPEFLKEGAAIHDFMNPDRIVIGTDSLKAGEMLREVYAPFSLKSDGIVTMDTASAEMTKYVSNAMLAARIGLMNEVANLCEAVGANVNHVRTGVGKDTRIGDQFLDPGCGYGGSCFPKDLRALIATARSHGMKMNILEAVERSNTAQKRLLSDKIRKMLPDAPPKAQATVAIWGLAFKPDTDDIREAPSIVLIDDLLAQGMEVRVYDPQAMKAGKVRWGTSITAAGDMYEAAAGADILVLVTEWKEFRLPNWGKIRTIMRSPRILDGRNLYSRQELEKEGFQYEGIGC